MPGKSSQATPEVWKRVSRNKLKCQTIELIRQMNGGTANCQGTC